MKTTKTPQQRALGRTRAQIGMLSVMFVLGMAENLIGQPSETHGISKATSVTVLALHVIIGLALLASGILAIRFTKGQGKSNRLAWFGGLGVLLAFTSGVLVMAKVAGTSWWSYLMALTFLEALLVYGALYFRLQKGQ